MRFNLHGQEKNGKAAAVVKKTRDCLQSCGAEGAAYVARRRKKQIGAIKKSFKTVKSDSNRLCRAFSAFRQRGH